MQLKEAMFEQLRVLDISKENQKFYKIKNRTCKEIAKEYQGQGLDIFFLQNHDIYITIPQELVLKKLGPEGKLLNSSKITKIYCDKETKLYDVNNYIKKIQSIFYGYNDKSIKTTKSEQKLLVAGKSMNNPYKKFFKEDEGLNHHYIKKCKICEKTIATCRCRSKNKKIIYDVCENCKSK